jgi:hypothetical protein
VLLLINDNDRQTIINSLHGIQTEAKNHYDIDWAVRELENFVEDLGRDIERQYDPNIRIVVVEDCVSVTVGGNVVFQYVHPDPWGLLATIHILDDRERNGKTEVLIEWGHGCGWCDDGMMFTRLVHRSLLPEVAS